MIRFSNYTKQYDGITIIGAPHLELEHGLYWLKGENGSGKTTLIKSIAGLIPYAGDIFVNGLNIRQQRRAYTLSVNYAEAEPVYPAFLTGNDLINFYTETKQPPAGLADRLIDALGARHYLTNRVGTYSSGMTKKLSLILGLLGKPKLLMLDEPLITLDQQSIVHLTETIKEYYHNGVTILITSHQEVQLPGLLVQPLYIQNKILIRS